MSQSKKDAAAVFPARRKRTPFRQADVGDFPRPARGARDVAQRKALQESSRERLQKALARSGLGSRRQMEKWIAEGRVQVNGKTAEIGDSVSFGDRIKVNGRLVSISFSRRAPRVLLYHKPEGEIVSRNDPEGRPNVFAALPRARGGRWVAVGRLDVNTSGLLLFTTSGELANSLLHPGTGLLREYAVRVLGELSAEAREALLKGVELEDGPAAFQSVEEAGGEGANRWYRVSLYEGRNREVRRLFAAAGLQVSRLIRVRYGPFVLPPGLRRGRTQELEEEGVRKLQRMLEKTGQSAALRAPSQTAAEKFGKKPFGKPAGNSDGRFTGTRARKSAGETSGKPVAPRARKPGRERF
ncbi:MAG: pseudouridine synthase [Zoogloeaceae bacterium]|jgi:23S rRNA pseudouridine2605 synthase|nr:pseudouridine synthase [Zoogloeaceae bacterium]